MEIMWIILALVIGVTLSLIMKSRGKKDSVGPFVLRESTYEGEHSVSLVKCKNPNISGEISIPENVTVIGACTFQDCSLIKSIQFNRVLRGIGTNSFDGCSSLTAVNLPNSVKRINEYCFKDCRGIRSLHLGDRISLIEAFAFQGCRQIDKITILNSVPADLHDTSFEDCVKKNCILTVPFGTKNIYSTSPSWREFSNIEEQSELN